VQTKTVRVENSNIYQTGDLVVWKWGKKKTNTHFGLVIEVEYMKASYHDGYSMRYGPPPMYQVMFGKKIETFTAEELLRVTLA
tara:strand:- start:721 stop:969 length:249 start_codon:yes stop_codon:yes gene_type:complete